MHMTVTLVRVGDQRFFFTPGRPRRAPPGRRAAPSTQPDGHDDGDLQRGADSQNEKRSQAARQATRWLGLLYFRAVRRPERAGSVLRPSLDLGKCGAEGI